MAAENILGATVPICGEARGQCGRGADDARRPPVLVTVRATPDNPAPPACCPHCRVAGRPPAPERPAGAPGLPGAPEGHPVPEAPKLAPGNDGLGLSIFTTGQIIVPLAKREYSREELLLFDLFGVEVQEFRARKGCVWSAPVDLLVEAEAAVRAYSEGRGGDPALVGRPMGVTSFRVPHAQKALDAELWALYEALSVNVIEIVVGPTTVAALSTQIERVRGRGAQALQDRKWETFPLANVGLRAYYAGPPAPILQALASFCGVPYCRVLGHGGAYWVAALDGPTLLASVRALGLSA